MAHYYVRRAAQITSQFHLVPSTDEESSVHHEKNEPVTHWIGRQVSSRGDFGVLNDRISSAARYMTSASFWDVIQPRYHNFEWYILYDIRRTKFFVYLYWKKTDQIQLGCSPVETIFLNSVLPPHLSILVILPLPNPIYATFKRWI
jgi:hypothetical protein